LDSLDWIALSLALLSGILMAVQGALNAVLSKFIGLAETTFMINFIGTVVLLAPLFLFKIGKINLQILSQAPWYTYLSGVIIVFIVYLVASSIGKVGAANATTAIIVGQIITAVVIDHLGLFGLQRIPWEWNQAIGVVLLAFGAHFMLK
jgi:transporter family-2 protein